MSIPKTYDVARIMLWEGCADSLDRRVDDLVAEDPLALSMEARTSLRRLANVWRDKAEAVREWLPPDLQGRL